MRGSRGVVAVDADVQVVFGSVHRVPGQPLEQEAVQTLQQATLSTHTHTVIKL